MKMEKERTDQGFIRKFFQMQNNGMLGIRRNLSEQGKTVSKAFRRQTEESQKVSRIFNNQCKRAQEATREVGKFLDWLSGRK